MYARDIGVCVKSRNDKNIILEYSSKNMYVVGYYYDGMGGWNYATCSDYDDDRYLVFFTISQIIQYSNLVNWDYFTENNILTISILDKLYDFIKWTRIVYNEFIDEKIIEHYRDDIKLIKAVPNRKYSEDFLYRNAEYLGWDSICEYNELSENFMRDFANKLNWYQVTSSQKLSTSFMEYYGDKIDWYTASSRQDLNENLIKKYSNRLSWKDISKYQVLSKELIETNMHRLDFLEMRSNKKMIQVYGIDYLDNLYVKANTISKLDSSADINLIMKTTNLIDECVVAEHIDRIDWSSGCYLSLSESFMIKYENKIDWSKMGKNKGLTKNIIKRHWGELCKKDLINNSWLNNELKTFINYCITTAYKDICDENVGIVEFKTNHPLKRNYKGDYELEKPDFGFIKNRYHEKIFFNVKGEYYNLQVGDYVKFKIVQGSKGPKAIHITKLTEIPIDINGYNKQVVKDSNINNRINEEKNNYRIKQEIESIKESKNINENLYNERGFYKNTAKHKNGTKYDDFGFDKFGYDKYGYDKYGYDKYGYDINGINKYGYKRQGVKDSNINNNRINEEKNNYRIKEEIKNVINKLKDKLTRKLFKG